MLQRARGAGAERCGGEARSEAACSALALGNAPLCCAAAIGPQALHTAPRADAAVARRQEARVSLWLYGKGTPYPLRRRLFSAQQAGATQLLPRFPALRAPLRDHAAMRRCGARLLRAALLSCLAALALGGDYYNTLGIARGADEATIKRNYHKLALCAPARRCARLGALCSERGGAALALQRRAQRADARLPGARFRRLGSGTRTRTRRTRRRPRPSSARRDPKATALP